jgi:hypothetical protein
MLSIETQPFTMHFHHPTNLNAFAPEESNIRKMKVPTNLQSCSKALSPFYILDWQSQTIKTEVPV